MRLYLNVCLQVMFAGGLLGSTGQKPDPAVLLEGYNLCNKEFETISYDLETDSRWGGRQIAYTLKHCSSNDSKQWIGHRTFHGKQSPIQPGTRGRIMSMWDANRMVQLYKDADEAGPNRSPRAFLWGPSRDRIQRDRSEDATYGGPLVGRYFGSDHHSVYDLLKGASNVTLHDAATKILDYDAYLLHADTRYGVVRAWISPDAGNNCLKWEIAKAQSQFYRDGATTNDPFTDWVAAYEAEAVEQVDCRYITTQAKFRMTVTDRDTQLSASTYRYKLTNVDFDPDYEAMGAFQIQLPEGTLVFDKDFPGVRYRWIDGQLQNAP